MDKATQLKKRQYGEIAGQQIPLDRPLRFGVLAEATTPIVASVQPETTEIPGAQQVRRPAMSPYFLFFLQDICAFAAISVFVAAMCVLSQDIAMTI